MMSQIMGKMKDITWPLFTFISSFLTMLALRIQYVNTVGLDEGIYLGVANNMVNGHILYKEIPESKPPLFHFLNALFVSIEGTNYVNIFIAFIVVSSLVALVIFFLVRELTSSNWCAFIGAMAFGVFSSLPITEIFWIMTEPYLILFNLMALLLFIKGMKSKAPYLFFLMGFFLSCAFLVRQTSVLFLFVIGIFVIYGLLKRTTQLKEFLLICAGTVLPFAVFIIYFLSVGGLNQMINAVFSAAVSDTVSQVSSISGSLKTIWLLEMVASSLPLIALSIFGLSKLKEKEQRIRVAVGILVAWILAVTLYYWLTPFGPGFHHEYAEAIGPLAVMAGVGVHEIILYLRGIDAPSSMARPKGMSNKRTITALIIAALLCTTAVPSIFANTTTLTTMPDDMKVVREVSAFLMENTSADEPTYVFETNKPKIGPLIYFESDREPVTLNRSVLFPADITDHDCQYTIDSLKSERVVYVIVIGGKPPEHHGYENAQRIYDQILTNYDLFKTLDPYTPYPGSAEDLPVEIYKKRT